MESIYVGSPTEKLQCALKKHHGQGVREIRAAPLEANVNPNIARALIGHIRVKAVGTEG